MPDQDGVTPSPSVRAPVHPGGRPAATRPAARPATLPSRAPARTTRRPVPAARLSASCPGGIETAARIGLSARGATVSWVATAAHGLEVSPASGSIKAGGSVRIWVTVTDPTAAGAGRVAFTSNGGTVSCALTWAGEDGHQPEASGPPDDGPAATPSEPAASPSGMASSAIDDMHGE
ncbi:hypothetical protein MF672_001635 [Actinomadura sp. ATCC 31491]|uniref:Ig-like domain-containing protein n=1 Tax=Actinomadura luzonensis TaxID=2805427 RepID=A0ABT0FJM1_9ACTN|nr:hypothetical protein [Actinomadura luzonensis]MCK2212507.1 hypothetical protein [Actinomadura luzonensis]